MRAERLDSSLFDRLAAASGSSLLSILMPSHRAGGEIIQDRIRFKNLIGEADDRLERAGHKPRERSRRLEVPSSVLDDEDFWKHQLEGLAAYVDDRGRAVLASLTRPVEAAVIVSPYFHVRHLIPSVSSMSATVLALSLQRVRLYEVSLDSIAEIDADLPGSIDDVNWFVDREVQRQQHPGGPGSSRNRHGHDPRDKGDEDLMRFLRAVAGALPQPRSQPLIVLADDDLAARFDSLVDLATVSPRHSRIRDMDDPEEVRSATASLIRSAEAEREQGHLARARDALQRGESVTSIEDALVGAVQGRLAELVISQAANPRWGRFEPETLRVDEVEAEAPDLVDLLDRLVVHVLRTGADVWTVSGPVDGYDFVAKTRY